MPALLLLVNPVLLAPGIYRDVSWWQATLIPTMGLPYACFSLGSKLVMVGFTLAAMAAFFRRKRNAPAWVIAVCGLSAALSVGQWGIAYCLDPAALSTETFAGAAAGSVLRALVATPYFLFSSRVKGTFTQR